MAPSTELLTRALVFPMDEVVERYAKEQRLPLRTAREHERELKRYLALSASEPGGFGMRGPIDELWHTFILFTEKYAMFCDQMGGRFLHHTPNTSSPTDAPAAGARGGVQAPSIREGYVRFLDAYQSAFGEPAPPHLWPRPMKHEDPYTVFDGCGCTTCSCVGGGCNCTIAIAEPAPFEFPEIQIQLPEIKLPDLPQRVAE